jgi:hypothetical protein
MIVLVAASPGAAQELEAFDLSDFLDPQFLIYETESGEKERVAFFWSRFTSGFLDGYQRRDMVNESGTGYFFARLASSLYFHRNQVNFELLAMDRAGLEDDQVADVRVQLARYFYTEVTETGERIPARSTASWRSAGPESLGFEDELSLSLEMALPLKQLANGALPETLDYLFGGYVYTYQPGHGDHYLSYAFRATVKQWATGPKMRLGAATGAEHVANHTRWGPSRLELSFVAPLPIFNSNLHLVYAPAYYPHPAEGSDHLSYEFGVFSDIPLGAKLFPAGRPTP